MDDELKRLDQRQESFTVLVETAPTPEKQVDAAKLLIAVLLRKQEIFKQQQENLKRQIK